MAVESVQEYLDDNGDRWEIRSRLHDGGLDLEVTAPGLEPRVLRPAPRSRCNSSRPSVDVEVPLPLENL